MSCRIGILVADDCVASPALGVMDLLAIANRIVRQNQDDTPPPFQTQLISMDGHAVNCHHGCQLSVDASVDQSGDLDVLFTPRFFIGSASEVADFLATQEGLVAWLQRHETRFPLIAAHCSGNLLLAEAGLLDGHEATTAWWLTSFMERHYPDIRINASAILVKSGRFLTGGSTSAYQDQALNLIEQEGGKYLARLVAKYAMIDNQRHSQSPYQILSLLEHSDPLVSRADKWLRNNLHRNLNMTDMAQQLDISPRTLIRRFQADLGISPQTHLQRLRIERSKALLETTTLPLEEVFKRCGYNDESAFRRLFSRYCQLSPREYRRRFNTGNAPPTVADRET